jgi:hypothetical protein
MNLWSAQNTERNTHPKTENTKSLPKTRNTKRRRRTSETRNTRKKSEPTRRTRRTRRIGSEMTSNPQLVSIKMNTGSLESSEMKITFKNNGERMSKTT